MFAAPYFLVGVVAGVIPILIHLIYRKRAPQILFSTIRFIRISTQKTARRRRIEDLLLLIFRVLLFSLLAMALSRPFLRAAGLLNPNAGVNAVVVLDNSMSMGARQGSRVDYDRAKEIAQETVRTLPSGSKAALVLTNGASRPEALSSDLAGVFEAVAGSEPSAERADLCGCLSAAYEILGAIQEPNREVFVITDMQKASWDGTWSPPEDVRTGDIHLVVVDVGGAQRRNLAVTRAVLHTRGRTAGARGAIEAEIQNASGVDEVNLPVTLHVDGRRVAEQVATVPANAKATVRFSHTFAEAGAHTGYIEIQVDDALCADNKRLFSANIGGQTSVLIVREKRHDISFLDPAFYLSLVLNPRISGGVVVSRIEHPQLASAKLGGTAVVFLVDLTKLSDAEGALLTDYVESGGNIVVFLGPNSRPGGMPNSLAPARLVKAVGDGEKREQFVTMGKADYDHPVFRPFRGLPPSAFTKVHVHQYFEVALPKGGEGRVLAYLSNNKPLLIERNVGAGKVLMFATAADTSWSNLPIRKVFLPMIHQVIYHLGDREVGQADYTAGAPVRLILPKEAAGKGVDVIDPLGRDTRLEPTEGGGVWSAVYGQTRMPGRYSWCAESDATMGGVFVVNPDPLESDLAPVPGSEVGGRLALPNVHLASSLEESESVVSGIREGVQLRDMILGIVIGIAVVECLLANRKRPAPQQETQAGAAGAE